MRKFFFTKYLTKTRLRKLIIEFAELQQVNLVVFNSKSSDLDGTYLPAKQIIFINNKQTKRSLLTTFFHELAHHTAVKKRKWVSFHFDLKQFTPEQTFIIENKIDKLARNLWYKYVNVRHWGKYKYHYPLKRKANLTDWIMTKQQTNKK